jgi:hypothetical protein
MLVLACPYDESLFDRIVQPVGNYLVRSSESVIVWDASPYHAGCNHGYIHCWF